VNATTFQLALNHTGWDEADLKGGLADDTTCATDTVIEVGLSAEKQDASSVCADAATGPIGLSPGASAIIYFKLTNGTLTSLDSGAQTTVNVFAGRAGAPQSVTVEGITYTP